MIKVKEIDNPTSMLLDVMHNANDITDIDIAEHNDLLIYFIYIYEEKYIYIYTDNSIENKTTISFALINILKQFII